MHRLSPLAVARKPLSISLNCQNLTASTRAIAASCSSAFRNSGVEEVFIQSIGDAEYILVDKETSHEAVVDAMRSMAETQSREDEVIIGQDIQQIFACP